MGQDDTIPEETPITKEFLERILKRKIISFKTSGGSNPGDNYTSILISLEIIVPDQKEPLHLLFKTFPHHPTRQKFLEEANIFLKEKEVYDTWLPALITFQIEVIGNDKILVPAMPEFVAGAAIDYQTGDPKEWSNLDPLLSNFVLMVDVRKTHGFKMANKLESLGYHHVKVVLEEIAKYHALGHAYKHHHKLTHVRSKFPFIEDTFFGKDDQRPMMEAMMKTNLDLVLNSCKDFLERNPKIKESVERFRDCKLVVEIMFSALKETGVDEVEFEKWMRTAPKGFTGPPLKDQWIVAGHGDCWTNNMLFKSDENGNVSETILVDLQIARESCITTDLAYFLYTSVDTDFRAKYLTEMLQWYHQRFVDFSEILKTPLFPGFTFENFQRKFHRSKIVGFVFASMVLPIILQRPETAVNMDSIVVKENLDAVEEFAEFFQNRGRDEDDNKLLRDRFSKMFEELYDEGVL